MSSYIVTCRECGAANRIPEGKEGVSGRCGSCKGELAPLYLTPKPLSDDSLDRFVSGYPGTVLAEFWAPW